MTISARYDSKQGKRCTSNGIHVPQHAFTHQSNDPVIVDAAMSASVIQITMTADDDTNPATRRYVTVALPREKLLAALAAATAKAAAEEKPGLRLITPE